MTHHSHADQMKPFPEKVIKTSPSRSWEVNLPEVPAEGLQWEVRFDPDVLWMIRNEFVPPKEDLTFGQRGTGTRALRFKSMKQGTTTLSLVLWDQKKKKIQQQRLYKIVTVGAI